MNLVEDHDLSRFEDDGNTVQPKIGIKVADSLEPNDLAAYTLKDTRPDRLRKRPRAESNAPLVIAGQADALAKPVELVNHVGESVSSLTWPSYLAWRKTKCRPYDYDKGPARATSVDDRVLVNLTDLARERALEEVDQAVLEFIGEVAELGEIFIEQGPTAFYGENRVKLIDECGDIYFCGAWALDAWGMNPLYDADDLEMLRVTDESELAAFSRVIVQADPKEALSNPQFVSMLGGLVFNLLLTAQTNAGLLANSFKKLRYQRREQDVRTQVSRIAEVLIAANQILVVANSSVEEALKSNMKKLDARFPEGYKPGVGGGIRTGEGK